MRNYLMVCLAVLAAGCGKSTGDWVTQLRTGDVPQRRQAIRALADNRSEAAAAVPALVQALQDPDAYVRRDAARALGKFGPEAKPAVPALQALRQDKVARVREAAAEALRKIDPEAGNPTHQKAGRR